MATSAKVIMILDKKRMISVHAPDLMAPTTIEEDGEWYPIRPFGAYAKFSPYFIPLDPPEDVLDIPEDILAQLIKNE